MSIFSGLRNGCLTLDSAGVTDTKIDYNINGANIYSEGLDITSSNDFKIANSASLGTDDAWILSTTGQRTMPNQPAFSAVGAGFAYYQAGGYYLGSLAALTVTLNRSTSFYAGDGAGTPAAFTAAIDGSYFFEFTNLSFMASKFLKPFDWDNFIIMTVARTYIVALEPTSHYKGIAHSGSIEQYGATGSIVVELTAGDTVKFFINPTISSSPGLSWISARSSYISGYLIG